MNSNQARHNAKLAALGRKRRAMYYRLHTNKNKPWKERTATALAKRFGVTPQRMGFMLRQAAKESA